MDPLIENTIRINDLLLSQQVTNDFSGYDPFDGLNSKLFNRTPLSNNFYCRLAWLQFFKRSPINFRGLALVPKMRNPKGIALFVLGLLEDYKRTKNPKFLELGIVLGEWLIENSCNRSDWGYYCWGYHFDWQAKAFYVPTGVPNIITTVYVIKAFEMIYELTKVSKFREISINAAQFIARRLYNESDQGAYFSYIPGESTFVHNANLWGAATTISLGVVSELSELIDVGVNSANRSIRGQNENGSWNYGASGHHKFIDSFHTGYNLEAINQISQSLKTTEFEKVLSIGMEYYLDNFFLDDGTCKYYDKKIYPIDTHAFAQAVLTLVKVGDSNTHRPVIDKIVVNAVNTLYIEKEHRFRYQVLRWRNNNIDYVRWTQAWAYYSLSVYNNHFS